MAGTWAAVAQWLHQYLCIILANSYFQTAKDLTYSTAFNGINSVGCTYQVHVSFSSNQTDFISFRILKGPILPIHNISQGDQKSRTSPLCYYIPLHLESKEHSINKLMSFKLLLLLSSVSNVVAYEIRSKTSSWKLEPFWTFMTLSPLSICGQSQSLSTYHWKSASCQKSPGEVEK